MGDRPLSGRGLILLFVADQYGVEHVRVNDEIAALEAERDELEAYLMDTLNQLDDCKLGYIDCLKSRSFELRRLEAERDRLRDVLASYQCMCIKSGSSDGTITVMQKCRRCAALEEGGEE